MQITGVDARHQLRQTVLNLFDRFDDYLQTRGQECFLRMKDICHRDIGGGCCLLGALLLSRHLPAIRAVLHRALIRTLT